MQAAHTGPRHPEWSHAGSQRREGPRFRLSQPATAAEHPPCTTRRDPRPSGSGCQPARPDCWSGAASVTTDLPHGTFRGQPVVPPGLGGGLGPLQSAAGRVASVEAVCQAGVLGHPLPPTGLWPRAGVAITPRSPPTAGAQRVGGLGGDRGPGGPGPALTPVTPARRPFHPWGRGVPDSAELLRKTYSDLLSL